MYKNLKIILIALTLVYVCGTVWNLLHSSSPVNSYAVDATL